MEESGVFSVNMEGSYCMGQGGVFFSEYGRYFLYGARWCFFQRKWKGVFVWSKVMCFSATMKENDQNSSWVSNSYFGSDNSFHKLPGFGGNQNHDF